MHFVGNATLHSPDGHWRLEVKDPPPQNREPLKVPVQVIHEYRHRPATYTLFDTRTGKQQWTREEALHEGCADYASVDDEGNTVVLTQYGNLLVIHGTGRVSLQTD